MDMNYFIIFVKNKNNVLATKTQSHQEKRGIKKLSVLVAIHKKR